MSTDTTTATTAAQPAKITGDFDFFTGHFDVAHRQLKNPLTGSDDWEEYTGTCHARILFDGAVSIDQVTFPSKGAYGMSLRLFDPVEKDWTIYWINSKTGKTQPPVRGRWDGDSCWLVGEDEHEGRPVLASYVWSDVTERTAKWQQAFSVDNGETWETNWVMEFTRRDDAPEPLGLPKVTDDFEFLNGVWQGEHQRLREPLTGSTEWYEFSSTLTGWTYFDGAVSVDEGVLPSLGFKGLTFRTFDPIAKEWSIYWINSLRGKLDTPVVGKFDAEGNGLFYGPDEHNGVPIEVRFHWRKNGPAPTWEQSFSTDGGQTWEANWRTTFRR
ncbi:hypothetical protein [Kribbella deserti]|uniref:DUF1579 domain-containing protein n=1 Tax=Kribbella deserti TaxID=1926257 RepID=A0ABV6QSC7_9ACTN